jgi:hypothetical protein
MRLELLARQRSHGRCGLIPWVDSTTIPFRHFAIGLAYNVA